MTDILLIRHGENDYTKKGKLAGWLPGVHLNETGLAQANAVAERLAKAAVKAIYSSPLERALETASPLAKAKKLSIHKRDGVGEVRYGDWTGKSLKALARTKLWEVVQRQPSAMEFPEGETLRTVQARAIEAIDEIARAHARGKGPVVAVSHGDVIKLVVAYYLGVPLDLFQRIVISTASITALRLGHGQPTLVKLNETPFESH
jgi:probable phosphoglycerate mutase